MLFLFASLDLGETMSNELHINLFNAETLNTAGMLIKIRPQAVSQATGREHPGCLGSPSYGSHTDIQIHSPL